MFQNKLKNFLEKESDKKKIIVIYGPTACGKTSLAVDVAKFLETEVISTDSRQIFKEMDIGTAKVTKEEMAGVKHHMIDIISPNKEYSVGEFKTKSEKIIKDLHDNGKIPVLAGGTGLYIDSLIYDFNIPKVIADWNLRKNLEDEAEKFGNEYIYEKLKKIDPQNYHKIHKNNIQYVIRAIEVKMISGISKYEQEVKKNPKYDILFLTPYDGDRERLYDRINKRVDIMLKDGLLNEIKNLLQKYNKTDFGMKTIGYEEIIKYIDFELNLDEAKDLIKKNSRNYAKRQLTWFRKYEK